MARRKFFNRNKDEVVVAQNEDGEATRGTTQEGNTDEVENTQSIPQNENGDEIETTEPTNPVAEEADEDRTDEEKEFANESNPNQKAREAGADAEVDQDGNPRTDGYSYGVAADDTDGTVPEEENLPEDEEEEEDQPTPAVFEEQSSTGDFLNTDTNNEEWDVEKQQKLEQQLSDPKNGILARVTTSAGKYVRVKFFRNNKPFATYRSRNFKTSEAKSFLSNFRKENDL